VLTASCALASSNNQHELSLDISDVTKKTSFYLAMEMCSFVLLVLDKGATPLAGFGGNNASGLDAGQLMIGGCAQLLRGEHAIARAVKG
jgi:hypothetical protein